MTAVYVYLEWLDEHLVIPWVFSKEEDAKEYGDVHLCIIDHLVHSSKPKANQNGKD